MEAVFLDVLNMSFTASWVILIVMAARLILKSVPRWIICLLWCVPVFRLLCPVTFESVLSLVPVKSQPIPENIAMQRVPDVAPQITATTTAIFACFAIKFNLTVPHYSKSFFRFTS